MGMIDKEDAIQAICEACYMYKYIGEHYRDCKYYPCDDINALEAVPEAPKPTGDLISRADAIEAVELADFVVDGGAKVVYEDDLLDRLNNLPSASYQQVGETQAAEAFDEMFKESNEYLGKLKSDEAVQGWIPCEEEMPIDSEEVIASVYWTEDGDSIIAYGHYSARFDKWRLYSDMEGELIKGYEVTAWMPLPKPYKGGDSE